MKYTKSIFLLSLLTTSLTLILAFALERFWLGASVAVGLGFLNWFGFYRQKWAWIGNLYLAGAIILAVIGALFELRLDLLLPAILGTIASWDLSRFQQRLRDEPISEVTLQIEKRHLILLGFALLSGGILTLLVVSFRVRLSFGVVLAVGVILIASLGQIFNLLRN